MKVANKIPMAIRDINFISRHDDADPALIEGALDKLSAHIESEKAEMKTRRAAKVKADLDAQLNPDDLKEAPVAKTDAAAKGGK